MTAKPTTDDEIRGILREHVRLTVDVTALDADADLYRAGMSSHASVNLMLAIEDKFGVEFPERMLRRKTFETMAHAGGGGSSPGMKTFVFSRALKPSDHPKVTIIADNAKKTLTALKKEPGKDIWLFGGGSLFASLLAAKLVDTVEVSIVPVLLGGGIPLLPPPAKRAKLNLTRQKTYQKTGIVSLEYAVK